MAENDLRAVAFPKLDEAQMASLERCPLTVLKQYRDREKLFETGQRDCSFYVVKSGQVEIVDESGKTPKIITIHGPESYWRGGAVDRRPIPRHCRGSGRL
jgi:thioredoxin reductase (NADPH)